MNALHPSLTDFFVWLLRTSIQASVLVLLILGLQAALRRWLTPRAQHALWLLLLARLALPWSPESTLSLFNWIPLPKPHIAMQAAMPQTQVALPVIKPEVTEGGTGILARDPEHQRTLREVQASRASLPMRSLNWLPYLGAIWLAGALVVMLRILYQCFVFTRRVVGRRPVTDQRVLDLLEDCKEALGVRAWLAVIETPSVQSPALFGFVRPRLLLPVRLTETLPADDLRHVFLHELAHLKRRDVLLSWLVALALSLHWFNPVIWYGFYRMRADRELACDALALSAARGAGVPQAYGRTILDLLTRLSGPQPRAAMSSMTGLSNLAGVLEEQSLMKRRLAMIARFNQRSYRWTAMATAMMGLLGCVALTNAKKAEKVSESKAEGAKLVIPKDGFQLQPYPEGGLYQLVVTIRNEGKLTSPSFDIDFASYYPERKIGTYSGSPIEPGGEFHKASLPQALQEGLGTYFVCVDPKDAVTPMDEGQKMAWLYIDVKDGKLLSQRTLRIRPKEAKELFDKAFTLKMQHKFDQAIKIWREIHDRWSDTTLAPFVLSETAFFQSGMTLNDRAGAIRTLEQAASEYPNFQRISDNIFCELGKNYESVGRAREAEAAYRKCIEIGQTLKGVSEVPYLEHVKYARERLASLGTSIPSVEAPAKNKSLEEMTQEITQTRVFEPGGLLEVENFNGDINVNTWDRSDIQITAMRKMKARPGVFSSVEDAQAYFDQLTYAIDGNGKKVSVNTHYPRSKNNVNLSVQYEIRVPVKAQLGLMTSNGEVGVAGTVGDMHAETSNGNIQIEQVKGAVRTISSNGRVRIENTAGDLTAITSNGTVECVAVRGRVEARTSNGKVYVRLTAAPRPDERLICSTSNGKIEVALPAESAFDIHAITTNGEISSDFPIELKRQGLGRVVKSRVGAGGAKIELVTTNGKINIQKTVAQAPTSSAATGKIDLAFDKVALEPYKEGNLYELVAAFYGPDDSAIRHFNMQFNRDGKPLNEVLSGSGQLEPGHHTSAGSMPFALSDGEHELSVVLDPNNEIDETDESNNRADMKVTVTGGQVRIDSLRIGGKPVTPEKSVIAKSPVEATPLPGAGK